MRAGGRIERESATLHRYSYVGHDPVNKKDPSGFLATLERTLLLAVIETIVVAHLLDDATDGQISRSIACIWTKVCDQLGIVF